MPHVSRVFEKSSICPEKTTCILAVESITLQDAGLELKTNVKTQTWDGVDGDGTMALQADCCTVDGGTIL